jgi:hypothetical protein
VHQPGELLALVIAQAAEKLVIDLIALRNGTVKQRLAFVGQIDKTAAFIGRIVLPAHQAARFHSAEHLRQRSLGADRRFNQRHLFDPGVLRYRAHHRILRFSQVRQRLLPAGGMYYLQRVTGMAPGAIGALMVPWSLASFAAITFTGRYFNRFGPRPLVVIGCLLQAMGIMLLLKIDADSPLALLILAFTLMGGGGSLCSSTAQSSAFLHTPAEEMPDASALWNLNRQLSFFAGSALLALLLRVFPPVYAWQGVFISAAVITLLPLLFCLRLNNRAIIHRLHTTLEKS